MELRMAYECENELVANMNQSQMDTNISQNKVVWRRFARQ